jgi:arylsulfatase A-like enzyme
MNQLLRLLISLPGLALAITSCGGGDESAGPRNLIVITADTLRADHLGSYGYHRETAPNIDAFASESLVFERCQAPIARTTPSHFSLMTGLYPLEHGVSSNFMQLPEAEQKRHAFRSEGALGTFAEAIGGAVHTAGFVSAAPVKRITGLASGFETWSEPKQTRRPGKRTNRAVFDWLIDHQGPFFLWVHYMDAHGPYQKGGYPPESYAGLFDMEDGLEEFLNRREFPERFSGVHVQDAQPGPMSNLYDGSIRLLDEAVGELFSGLKEKGVWEDSVIVFLSDHGQGLGQHGYAGHGDVWEEQLQVPLMIKAPGLAPGRNDTLMSIIDVLPTALSLAPDFPAGGFLEQARGVDVLGETRGTPTVFGMGGRDEGTFSMSAEGWKYIHRPGGVDSLFYLAQDPFELKDLIDTEPELAASMRSRLLDEIEAQRAVYEELGSRASASGIDPVHLEELRALGYTGDEESSDSH